MTRPAPVGAESSAADHVAHVAHFRWNPAVTAADVDRVRSALHALRSQLHGVVYYAFGPDLQLRAGNADFAVVGIFTDLEAYNRYAEHPEHLRILHEVITPLLDVRSAVQLSVPTPT